MTASTDCGSRIRSICRESALMTCARNVCPVSDEANVMYHRPDTVKPDIKDWSVILHLPHPFPLPGRT